MLFDRIKQNAGSAVDVPTLLAHVMTHEITHLLEGISRHSVTGVMKAHWDARDFADMVRAPLPFAPEDIDLIQSGMVRRAAGSTSAVPTGAMTKLQ